MTSSTEARPETLPTNAVVEVIADTLDTALHELAGKRLGFVLLITDADEVAVASNLTARLALPLAESATIRLRDMIAREQPPE